MTQGKNIKHRRRRAKPGEISGQRGLGGGGDSGLQGSDRKLAIGLAERHQPDPGGDQIRRKSRQKGEGRITRRNALFRRRRTKGHRMGKLARMARGKGREAWCGPGGQCHAGKGGALRFRFQSGFCRAAPGSTQRRDLVQGLVIALHHGAMRGHQQGAIHPPGA